MDGHDEWRTRHGEVGQRLDHVNVAVRNALMAGDARDYVAQLLERAWVAMVFRDLHGRTTVLGRTWEQFMLTDLELAMRTIRDHTPLGCWAPCPELAGAQLSQDRAMTQSDGAAGSGMCGPSVRHPTTPARPRRR